MTKAFLKKCSIALSSTCLLGIVIALACTDPWGEEYGTSNFTPEVFVARTYSPFFYSVQFYYGIDHDEAQFTRWNQTNVDAWASWLGNHPSPDELSYLLDTANATIINQAAAWADGRRSILPQPLAAFRLFSNRSNKKVAGFLHYLVLAKKAETFALTPIRQPWDQDSTKKKPFDATTLDKQLQQGLTTTDPFLQERYWFQLIRSHFFNGTPDQTIRLFEDYRTRFPANKLWYRSLAYMAGAWYKRKEYGKANYYYSRVFDSCDELKTVAHYSFHPQEQNDWNATLALCRNSEEKATLWQMLGIFYSDPNRAIEEIYNLDPHSEKLDILLSRAVNVAEQGFNPHDDPYEAPTYDNRQAFALITRIATAGNTAKPWVWQLAAGYLSMLNEQYAAAASWYEKAEATIPHENGPQKQFRLLKMLNTIDSTPTIDQPLEQRLLPDLEWLVAEQRAGDIRTYDATDWLKKTFAAKYKKTGDVIKAECLVHESNFYTDNKKVEAMKAFLAKPAKTPYEVFCLQFYDNIKLPDIYAYQAALLSMSGHPDEALTAISHVPNAARDTLPGNPFNARIDDCHDCDHQAPQKIKYTQLSFLQKLKELKDKIAAGNDVYTNAILLGNAQYNCTHFGNARAFYEGEILGSGAGTPETIDSAFRAPLTDMSSAIKYYTLAAGAARTDEQRAKCQYLLAKCQRNQWYMHCFNSFYGYEENTGPAFIAFDGFKGLKQYPNTNYYKEVIRECGYFKTYILKNP
jgi:hypothetical protein